MPSNLRMKRINDRFKEVLAMVLLTKMEDPRLSDVTVTDVKVDRELDYANIYVSAPGGQAREKDVLAGLNHARGFLKYEISGEIDLRLMPKLRFFWDPTPERADRIDTLLAQIRGDIPMEDGSIYPAMADEEDPKDAEAEDAEASEESDE